MLQYQGQAFPKESFPGNENVREEHYINTTSYNNVIKVFYQSAIVDMIRSFNSSGPESDRCRPLTQHVNMRLQGESSTYGNEGTWSYWRILAYTQYGPCRQWLTEE